MKRWNKEDFGRSLNKDKSFIPRAETAVSVELQLQGRFLPVKITDKSSIFINLINKLLIINGISNFNTETQS